MPIKIERKLWGYAHVGMFFISLIAAAFILDVPLNIFRGFLKIMVSPSNLITDYMAIGGLGAALFNSGVVGFFALLKLRISRVLITGGAIAGLITICGFALFGKNLYNSLPITVGVYLYALFRRIPYKDVAVSGLFATALGPLVSVLSFGLGLGSWQGIVSGCVAGIVIGLIIPPLADSFIRFHRGYNLYNIGFTAGIVGMFATGILRMFNLQVETTSILSGGNNVALSVYLLLLLSAILVFGLSRNKWTFKNYRQLFKLSGQLKTDFIKNCGYGITLINIAVMGFICWAYVIILGCQLNGATIGAIFTVMGFSAFGVHPKNTLPIFIGALLASLLNIHEVHGTVSVIAALFGSTLAPIAGRFGVLAGVFAGFTHVSMTMNIGYLHGGMNLYNNGFSGGFIAATLVPLFSAISEKRRGKKAVCTEVDEADICL